MSPKRAVRVVRIYDEPDPEDGQRVLIDRIWPRGIRKDDPRVGVWCKDVAPSKDLREWYHHQPDLYDEFAARYEAELAGNPALAELRTLAKRGTLTLVTANRQVEISHATVLAKLLSRRT
ncbi:hypothetical protein A5634_15770 [Mycobacterium asiaticum]|uniref:MarR family transcriptional regulator n=1 Tax=Mycobacterium asiaticum TaxID=1790 RepID=A0A1A3P9A0_MYCAS|nr:DUF488 family protein [Mycobacterium asiaticum]OBK30731.1 hypothetical protein A5634_15770 [Mycobacterium asiaticum]